MKLLPGPNSTGRFAFRVGSGKYDIVCVDDAGLEIDELTSEMTNYVNAGFLSVSHDAIEAGEQPPVPKRQRKQKEKPISGKDDSLGKAGDEPVGPDVNIDDVLGS